MANRAIWSATLTLIALGAPAAMGRQEVSQRALIKSILAEWRARHSEITSLKCSAKVESFYPKGSLSESAPILDRKDKALWTFPEADQRFTDEPCTWAIDFAAKRIRREYRITRPYYSGGGSKCELFPGKVLTLFADGKYRKFSPRGEGGKSQDATLYERASHSFVLAGNDDPLLWFAGGVSGQWPSPSHMQRLDDPERFSFRGFVELKGQKCVILTVQNQKSGTSVREFWVGINRPYPIYQSRSRDGQTVHWQVQVDYAEQEGYLVPSRWALTEYNLPGKLFTRETVEVDKFEINPALPADLFYKRLEQGMVVFHAEDNDFYDVDYFGNLVPKGTGFQLPGWFFWGVGAVLLLIGALLAWRLLRKRPKGAAG